MPTWYHGWGSEFGVEYTPLDVGLGRFLDLDKPDFVGRDALLELAAAPPARAYGVWTVDLEGLAGRAGDPPPSAPIRVDGRLVGFVTSAAMGFRTGARVCLGYVEGRFATARADFTVDVFGAQCPARRHAHGVYDPGNERLRS